VSTWQLLPAFGDLYKGVREHMASYFDRTDPESRELAEETTKIHPEPELSEEAKARYVGDVRERAQAKYAESALLKTQDA
jgi:hypothetical protein